MAITGKVSRGIPTAYEDANEIALRASRFGELYTQSVHGSRHALADEGAYYIATNPTPDTGIVLTTSITAFAETAGAVSAVLAMTNKSTTNVASSVRIYLDYIKLKLVAQAPTSATLWRYAFTLNDNPLTYTSGGSTITPVNANCEKASASNATLYFGALTTAVPTNRRLIGHGLLRAQVPVIMDQYIITFGDAPSNGSYWVSAAGVQRLLEVAPPIIIPPGWWLLMHMWGTSNAAASQWEFEMGWWEK